MSVNSVATEPAVFELACVLNKIKHIVICGHSDCKAVNMLYDIHTDPTDEPPQVSAVSYIILQTISSNVLAVCSPSPPCAPG